MSKESIKARSFSKMTPKDKKSKKKAITVDPDAAKKAPTKRDSYGAAIKKIIEKRKKIRVIVNGEDLTPPTIDKAVINKRFEFQDSKGNTLNRWNILLETLYNMDLGIHDGGVGKEVSMRQSTKQQSSFATSMKTSLEDIINISFGIGSQDDVPYWRTESEEPEVPQIEKVPPFIKIRLTESPDIFLFEKPSITVTKEAAESKLVEDDNKLYDYYTIGKGKGRRKTDSEAQTREILYKTRECNTDGIKKIQIGSFVSNFDMFDTYKELEKVTHSVELDGQQTFEITTYKPDGVDQFAEICKTQQFFLANMLLQRLLAGNIFREQQRRFRNMFVPDPLAIKVSYYYTFNTLWELPAQTTEKKAVTSISWCPKNGDLMAVAYGIYNFIASTDITGLVCVWSIKNPVNPERKYVYSIPIVSVEFSPYVPQLLAIGTYDGTVEIRDITNPNDPPIAVSIRDTSPGFEPVNSMRWISLGTGEKQDYEPLLTVSQDGNIMKYRLVNSPHLIGFQQMKLNRIEGIPEGLKIKPREGFIEANRNSHALTLTPHPTHGDIYFVLTDEGSLHKCSINYPLQHIDLMKVHDGNVYSMNYSPWSPKLFLTCGSDWCIRIWIEGILEPLMQLSASRSPVHCAYWSTTHSTIIISIVRDALQIWDIRRSNLRPVNVVNLGKSFLTIGKFSNCGRSFAIGNERGNVIVGAFEDMPFPPNFQYKELESAIFKGIADNPELTNEFKSLGFWGYPNKP